MKGFVVQAECALLHPCKSCNEGHEKAKGIHNAHFDICHLSRHQNCNRNLRKEEAFFKMKLRMYLSCMADIRRSTQVKFTESHTHSFSLLQT